jgi:Tol biopolymer transport system component
MHPSGVTSIRRTPCAILLAATVFLVSVLIAAPARADFHGRDGLVVFTRSGDLYTARPNSSGLRRLTTNGGAFGRWSPDGRQIAFNRAGHVWVMSADGSHQRMLISGWGGTWSPDGKRLAAVQTSSCDGFQGDTLDRVITFTPSSPLGTRQVVATYSYCDNTSWVSGGPRWLPDGKHIAVVGSAGYGDFLGIGVDIISVSQRRVVKTVFNTWCDYTGVSGCPLGNGNVTDLHVDASPNGTQLVFASDQGPVRGRTSLYTVPAGGGHVTRMSNTYYDTGPAWSPDGLMLAYTDSTPGTTRSVHFRVIGASGPSSTVISNAAEPDWQPVR